MTTFDELKAFLSSIPCIDNGGCGFAALAMHLHLNRAGESSALVFLNNRASSDVVVANAKWEIDRSESPKGACHVALYYNGQFMDHSSIINPTGYKYIEFVTQEKVWAALDNKGSWNESFDRDTYISEIENYLGLCIYDKDRNKAPAF